MYPSLHQQEVFTLGFYKDILSLEIFFIKGNQLWGNVCQIVNICQAQSLQLNFCTTVKPFELLHAIFNL